MVTDYCAPGHGASCASAPSGQAACLPSALIALESFFLFLKGAVCFFPLMGQALDSGPQIFRFFYYSHSAGGSSLSETRTKSHSGFLKTDGLP